MNRQLNQEIQQWWIQRREASLDFRESAAHYFEATTTDSTKVTATKVSSEEIELFPNSIVTIHWDILSWTDADSRPTTFHGITTFHNPISGPTLAFHTTIATHNNISPTFSWTANLVGAAPNSILRPEVSGASGKTVVWKIWGYNLRYFNY